MMFMITEVHPFQDGNGRTARAMMNDELVAKRQRRILIPSVYRTEYVGALKRLTNHKDPQGCIRVLDYAQEFARRSDFTTLTAARQLLTSCNAFRDPAEGGKLVMPPKMDK